MQSTTAIELNLNTPGIPVTAYAKQNDKLSRYIAATLVSGSTAWEPPAEVGAAIRYHKPDGTTGFYDVDENDQSAIQISGNVATLYLAEQVLTAPGTVQMELNFYTAAGDKLTSFAWTLAVQASVVTDDAIVSSDYYNTLTAQIATALAYRDAAASSAAQAALSASQAAETIASAVKSVNGISPDAEGAVDIPMVSNTKDYIVESGGNAYWTWRKWASGRAECWRHRTIENINCTVAWGSMYETEETWGSDGYPFTFTSVPDQHVDTSPVSGGLVFVEPITNTAIETGTWRFYRPTSASGISARINFYVVGSWK